MELKLVRDQSKDNATLGKLYINDVFECFTLEDVVREIKDISVEQWKVQGQTAIPFGKYRVVIDFSNRYQRPMPHILNVEGFEGIRIHSGNTAKDTEGCILLGSVVSGNTILHSRETFNTFFAKLENALKNNEGATITIGG